MASVPIPITLFPTQTITTGVDGPLIALPAGSFGRTLSLLLWVTALSGTNPTLDASFQWSFDGVYSFNVEPFDFFNQKTIVAGYVKLFTVKAPFVKVGLGVGGTTPSFTVSVTGMVETDRTT